MQIKQTHFERKFAGRLTGGGGGGESPSVYCCLCVRSHVLAIFEMILSRAFQLCECRPLVCIGKYIMCVALQLGNQYEINPFSDQRAKLSACDVYDTHSKNAGTQLKSNRQNRLKQRFRKPNVKIAHSFLLFSPETVGFAFSMGWPFFHPYFLFLL